MSQQFDSPTRPFICGAAIAQYLRVLLGASTVTAAGSTDQEVGTLEVASFASGDVRSVRLRTAPGTTKFVANAAITKGNAVYAAASGKVGASGTLLIGIAMETVSADGDVIEVLRRQENSDASAAGGTTAAAFLVDSDATTPKIELAAQTGGTGDFKQTIKPAATLTANRTITLPPDVSVTLASVAGTETLTNKTLTAPIVNSPVVTDKGTAKTADYTVVAATDSGQVFTNNAASGTVVFALPAATVGQKYRFAVGAAQALRLDPNLTETISLPSTGVPGAGGKYLGCATVGCSIDIECTLAGTWNVFGYTGTWLSEA